MPGPVTYLDVGSTCLKIVTLESGPLPRVQKALQIRVQRAEKGETVPKHLGTLLQKSFRENAIPTSHLVVILKDSQLVTQTFDLPVKSWRQVREDARKRILDQSGLDSLDTRIWIEPVRDVALSAPGRVHVKVTAVPPSLLDQALALASPLGPGKLSLCSLQDGLAGLTTLLTRNMASTITAIIRISNSSTTLCLCQNGIPLLSRIIPTGGSNFTRVLSGELFFEGIVLTTTPDEAEAIKELQGITLDESAPTTSAQVKLPPDLTNSLLAPLLENFTTEIKRFFTFARHEIQFEKIHALYVTGLGSRVKNLEGYFEQILGIPAERVPLAACAVPAPGMDARLLESDYEGFTHLLGLHANHRRTDFLKKKNLASQVRDLLDKAYAPILFGLLIICYTLLATYSQNLRNQGNDLEQVWSEKVIKYANYFQTQGAKRDLLKALSDMIEFKQQQVPWTGLFRELSRVRPREIQYLNIQLETPPAYEILPEYTMVLTGQVRESPDKRAERIISELLERLYASPWIKTTELLSLSQVTPLQRPGEDPPASKEFRIKAQLDLPQ